MKRRTVQPRRLRDRRSGQSPYAKYQKRPHRYPFPTGPGAWEKRRHLPGWSS